MTCNSFYFYVISLNYNRNPSVTFKGNYGKIIKKSKYFDIIFFNNQLCVKLLNNVTVLLKLVHAVRQGIDKGSFLKMTSLKQLVFTRVLVLFSSFRPITGMSLSDETINCVA